MICITVFVFKVNKLFFLVGLSFCHPELAGGSPANVRGDASTPLRSAQHDRNVSVGMSAGFSERWESPSECPKVSPSVGAARRNVRRFLRALGWPVGMSAGFPERWESPSECPKVSPSVGTARRNVRRFLRAFGEPVGMSESLSERWESPSECPKVSPSIGTARRNVRKSLRALGGLRKQFSGLSKLLGCLFIDFAPIQVNCRRRVCTSSLIRSGRRSCGQGHSARGRPSPVWFRRYLPGLHRCLVPGRCLPSSRR